MGRPRRTPLRATASHPPTPSTRASKRRRLRKEVTRLTDLPIQLLVRIFSHIVSHVPNRPSSLYGSFCPVHLPQAIYESPSNRTPDGFQVGLSRERVVIPRMLYSILCVSRTFATALAMALGHHATHLSYRDIASHPAVSLVACRQVVKSYEARLSCPCDLGNERQSRDFLGPLQMLASFHFPHLEVLDLSDILAPFISVKRTRDQLVSCVSKVFQNLSSSLKTLIIPCRQLYKPILQAASFPSLRHVCLGDVDSDDFPPGMTSLNLLMALAGITSPPQLQKLTLRCIPFLPDPPPITSDDPFCRMLASVTDLHLEQCWHWGARIAPQPPERFFSFFPALKRLAWNEHVDAACMRRIVELCPLLEVVTLGPVSINKTCHCSGALRKQMLFTTNIDALLFTTNIDALIEIREVLGDSRLRLQLAHTDVCTIPKLIDHNLPICVASFKMGTRKLRLLEEFCAANFETLRELVIDLDNSRKYDDDDCAQLDKDGWEVLARAVGRAQYLTKLEFGMAEESIHSHSAAVAAAGVEACLKTMGKEVRDVTFWLSCELEGTLLYCAELLEIHHRVIRCLGDHGPQVRLFSLVVANEQWAPVRKADVRSERTRYWMMKLIHELDATERRTQLLYAGVSGRIAQDFVSLEQM